MGDIGNPRTTLRLYEAEITDFGGQQAFAQRHVREPARIVSSSLDDVLTTTSRIHVHRRSFRPPTRTHFAFHIETPVKALPDSSHRCKDSRRSGL